MIVYVVWRPKQGMIDGVYFSADEAEAYMENHEDAEWTDFVAQAFKVHGEA